MVMPYDPAQAVAPQQQSRLPSLNPGFLQALSGFASGNNVGEQFGNVNALLANQNEQQKADEVKNKTLSILEGQSPEIAAALKAGAMTPQQAMSAAMQQRQAAADAAKPKWELQNINGRLIRVEVNSKQVDELGNYEKAAEPTSSYKDFQQAQSDPAYAEFLKQQKPATSTFEGRVKIAQELGMDPSDPAYKAFVATGKFPREDQSPLTAVDKKAILDAEDAIAANQAVISNLDSLVSGPEGETLNDKAGSGYFAGTQSFLARNDPTGFFDDKTGEATTEFNNVVLSNTLGQLKSIFGSAPTEGERIVLRELEASVDKTPKERAAIITRAKALAEKRLEVNQARANDIRGGDFYKPKQPATNSGVTKTGLKFTVEP